MITFRSHPSPSIVQPLFEELQLNNSQILAPLERLWAHLGKLIAADEWHLRDPDEAAACWEDSISRETDFVFSSRAPADSKRVSRTAFDLDKRTTSEELVHAGANKGIDIQVVLDRCYLKIDRLAPLVSMWQQNIDILQELCREDLRGRLGAEFKGYYPYSGMDVDLLWQLGGRWFVVDPCFDEAHGLSVTRQTQYGALAVSSQRLQYALPPIASPALTAYDPDVLLIKHPDPSAQADDVLADCAPYLKRDTLIVADEELTHASLKPIEDLAGITGMRTLYTINPVPRFGSLSLPMSGFRMYVFENDLI